MRNLLAIAALSFIGLANGVKAQSVEFRPTYAYTYQETVPITEGSGVIKASSTYGFNFALILKDAIDLNFTYQVQPTTFDIKRYPAPTKTGDYGNGVNVSYYQFGINRYVLIPGRDNIIPYMGLKIGSVHWTPNDAKYQSTQKAAVGATLGVKIMVKPRIGIAPYALLQMPVSGLGLSIGTGGAGVSTYSYAVQFSMGAALVIKLK